MNKKADFGWEEISRIILALIFLLALIFIIILFKDKLLDLIEKIRYFFRFG